MNYMKEYLDKINSGEIIVGKKIKKIYTRLVKESESKTLSFYFAIFLLPYQVSVKMKNIQKTVYMKY